ncbi:MAG: sugar phosphate isomerase/epimerase [Propioniciclava sp.]|uniref:sugar phosphate isomerase/epimerase family protein n=1 Tax=Propioniciclava sp. TaxID=2038686 RepID=UPI0039E68BC7
MSHRYSLGYLTVGDLEPSAQVYVAKEAGYDYVGLRPIAMGLPSEPHLDIAHDSRLLADCRTALDETGIEVWDIELARVLDEIDYDTYAPALEVGAALGARVLLTSVWTDDPLKQVRGLKRVTDLASQFGLTVVAEFVPLSKVKSLDAMSALVREVDAGNLGILIDVYHWQRSGAPLDAVAALPREWLPMIHLCDCPAESPGDLEAIRYEVRERRLYVGEGDAAITDLIARLPTDVVLAIEQPHLERLRVLGDAEYARRALQHAKAVIDPVFAATEPVGASR